MSPTHPLVLAALAEHEQDRATGFASPTPVRSRIQNELSQAALLELIHELAGSGNVAERELSARLLLQSPLPGSTVVEEVRRALADEDSGEVIRWLVSALQYAREPTALAELETLARHPDPAVRFGVPDALSSSSTELRDIEDTIIELSRDIDRDVRWSATFELISWLAEPDETNGGDVRRLLARLTELAASDPDPEIRSMAAQAVIDPHGF